MVDTVKFDIELDVPYLEFLSIAEQVAYIQMQARRLHFHSGVYIKKWGYKLISRKWYVNYPEIVYIVEHHTDWKSK